MMKSESVLRHLSLKSHSKKMDRFFDEYGIEKSWKAHFEIKPLKWKEYKQRVEEFERNEVIRKQKDKEQAENRFVVMMKRMEEVKKRDGKMLKNDVFKMFY